MKRKLINKFIEWNDRVDNKGMPILLTGARGVGKTYLAYEFAHDFYQHIIYLNFETQPSLNDCMEQDEDIFCHDFFSGTEMQVLSNSYNQETEIMEPNEIICILDEVSHCHNVIKLLSMLQKINSQRRLREKNPVTILMVSSRGKDVTSLLLQNKITFKQFTLYPMDMEEFLLATGNEWYVGVINEHFATNKKIPDIVHKDLLTLYEAYIRVGGMPEAVNEFFIMPKIDNISERHRILLQGMLADVARERDSSETLKVSQVFSTIHTQLIKPNKKFQYRQIRKGATKQMYETAIDYLVDYNFAMKATKLQQEKDTQFKLYLQDTGLLSTIYHMDLGLLKHYSEEELRKVLIENSVAQTLTSNGYSLTYWESASQAKVEFVLGEKEFLPIEVRGNDKTRSKNVSIMKEEYPVEASVKISSRNFEYNNKIKYIPYYAVYCL